MEDQNLCQEIGIELRKHEEIKKVNVQFSIFMVGFNLLMGPFLAVITLQSSINIEESVGTTSLGIGYTMSALFLIFFGPTLLRRYGSKAVMITGESSYLIYIAANFYPVSSVMILAGVLLGLGEAAVWSSIPLFNTHFGKCQGEIGRKMKKSYVRKFNGLFFACIQIGSVLGNLCSYLILHGLKSKTAEINKTEGNASTMFYENSTNLKQTEADYFQYCGANDCQNPNVTTQERDRYVPDQLSIYFLMGVFCILSLCGIMLHIRFLPETLLKTNEGKGTEDKNCTDSEENRILSRGMMDTLVESWKQQINIKQVLLVPYSFFLGMTIGLLFGELSRAYTSCVLGVEQIGLAAITFGTVTGISSLLSRKTIGYFGRNKTLLVLFTIDMTNYVFCLLWRPEVDTAWLVYFIFVVFGMTDGLWRTTLLNLFNEYFTKNLDIAFVLWNLWVTIGIGVQFVWSPLMCVSTKLYIQMALLLLTIICYGAAEKINRLELEKQKNLSRDLN